MGFQTAFKRLVLIYRQPGTWLLSVNVGCRSGVFVEKASLLKIHLEDELWLDSLGFAYGDDELEFYKLHVNGGKLMVSFDGGISNLDAKRRVLHTVGRQSDFHYGNGQYHKMASHALHDLEITV